MKRLSRAVLVLALLAAPGEGIARARAADSKTPSELIVDVDVNDEVWLRDHNMTEADIKALVANLKQNGCQTLIVRCGCLGLLPYRTDLSYPVGFDAEHARTHPAPAVIPDLAAYIATRTAWNKRYAEVIHDINPPAAFIRAGHDQGMQVIAWIDIFDDGFPGYRSKFLDEHPHCQWVGKDGKTYFEGLMDYSWPEARAFRVAQARELLDLGADGIDCSTSAHCRHLPNTHAEDFYGYSQPIVEAFQATYGVDIRTAQDFDKAAWHDLKGQSMVQLYRDLATLCHDRGKQLWIGLQFGRYTQFAADGYFSTNVVARYANHWKTLVDEGLADAFILGDYEPMGEPDTPYWTTKTDIQRRDGEDLYAWAAREYQAYCKGKTRLYLWGYADPAMVVKYGFDGIDVHEAWDYESQDGWTRLRSIAELLKGNTPSP